MNLFETIWADLNKLFAFAPLVAAIDPNAAGGIATAELAVAALQPTISVLSQNANGTLSHDQLVQQTTNAVAQSSASLTKLGMVSATTDQHIQAAVPLINAAVAISGLALPTVTAAPVLKPL